VGGRQLALLGGEQEKKAGKDSRINKGWMRRQEGGGKRERRA
jgi:hypothetical protein